MIDIQYSITIMGGRKVSQSIIYPHKFSTVPPLPPPFPHKSVVKPRLFPHKSVKGVAFYADNQVLCGVVINRPQNEEQNLKAVRLSMKGYVDQEWMENVPLYATASFFKKIKHNSSI